MSKLLNFLGMNFGSSLYLLFKSGLSSRFVFDILFIISLFFSMGILMTFLSSLNDTAPVAISSFLSKFLAQV